MSESHKKPSINYTNREYESIRKDLVNYVRNYYPDTYKDFNEASFGAMMFDLVSYVADNLSFYIDFQANESFLETAIQYENILKTAKQMGYKLPGAPTAHGIVALYVRVPAMGTGQGPDVNYMPKIKKGALL